MCLTSVTSTEYEETPKGEYHTGWKAVSIHKDIMKFYSMWNCGRLLNKWHRCNKTNRLTTVSGFDSYDLGFHIFATREGARFWKRHWAGYRVVKVRYRNVVARGIQGGLKCIIAKEMYVEAPK